MKLYQFEYPIAVMSHVLAVSSSGYYAWLNRKPNLRVQCDAIHEVHVKAAHEAARQTYGDERLHAELEANGIVISTYKVRALRQRLGLFCRQKKRYKCTTNSNHSKTVAPNLLEQHFTVTRPNQVWVSDITYIWINEGWLYLAGIKDLYSCEIVGYAIGERMTVELCIAALQMALLRRRPNAGLILHSDRGSQYCAKAYQQLLSVVGIIASMSRRGNCYDNAPMESFWGSLKNELIHQETYARRQTAIDEIVEYIEIFYNRKRRHASLGNISPAQALKQFKLRQEELVLSGSVHFIQQGSP